MGRGVWRATVHGVAALDMTERLSTHTLWRQLGGPGWEYCVKAANAVVCLCLDFQSLLVSHDAAQAECVCVGGGRLGL